MVNWRTIPFVRLLLPLITGILLATYVEVQIPFGDATLLALLASFSFYISRKIDFQNRWVAGLLICLTLGLFGYQRTYSYNELTDKAHFKTHIQKENAILGYVSEMPRYGSKAKIQLRVQAIAVDGIWQDASGNLLLYAEIDSLTRNLHYGNQIYYTTSIRTIEPPKNPMAFDAKRYYHFQNIHHQAYVAEGGIQKTDQQCGMVFYNVAHYLRSNAIHALQKYIPNTQNRAVGEALILGYKNDLTDDLKEAYADTGAMHVLAVSGLHVGIVAWILGILLSWIPYRKKWAKWLKVVVQIAGIFAFAFLTGASPSVLRAATMFSLIVAGLASNRFSNIYNIIAASAFVQLVINPYALMHVGFQLSYLAVLGIVAFQPLLERQLYFENKIARYFWTLAAVAIAAQIGTLPLSLYYFHQFPVYFLLSGFLVVPAAGVILGLGLLLLAFAWLAPAATAIAWVLNAVLWVVNAFIFGLAQMPYGTIEAIWVGFGGVLLLYAAISMLVVATKSPKLRWINYALVFLLVFLTVNAWHWVRCYGEREVVVYDVYRNSLIDVFDGFENMMFKSSYVEDKHITFSAAPYRTFRGIRKAKNTSFEIKDFPIQQLDLGDQSLLIVQDAIKTVPKKYDYVLIRNNPSLSLDIFKENPPQMFIFDSSNAVFNIKKWTQGCEKQGIAYHITKTAGAFALKI